MNTVMFTNKSFSGKKVVALGKFDGIHTAHARLLECAAQCAAAEGVLSLVYAMEPSGGKRLTQTDEKSCLVRSFGIDALCIEPLTQDFMSMDAKTFVRDILKDKLDACRVVVGYNFRFAKDRSGDTEALKKYCKEHDIAVTVIDCVYGEEAGEQVVVSSSEIRRLASLGKVDALSPLLGRNYSVSGIVEKGKNLGSKLDFPTANIYKDMSTLPLKHGVYHTKAHFDGLDFDALTNVGTNPTVDMSDDVVKIETHIPCFDGDMYGKKLTVEFLEYIRDEKKFSTIDELKFQLKKDMEHLNK